MTTNTITAIITAYCACTTICCPKSSQGLTAYGNKPTPNHTIAASRIYPFGTKVRIANKEYVVEDRLALRFDKRFDVYMSSHKEALQHGIKTQQVTIITK